MHTITDTKENQVNDGMILRLCVDLAPLHCLQSSPLRHEWLMQRERLFIRGISGHS